METKNKGEKCGQTLWVKTQAKNMWSKRTSRKQIDKWKTQKAIEKQSKNIDRKHM